MTTPEDRAALGRNVQNFETMNTPDRAYRVIGWLAGALVAALIGLAFARSVL